MTSLIAAFVTSFVITYVAIPSIIRVANIKHLFDEPGERKNHTTNTPTLGGMAMFAGFLLAVTFWCDSAHFANLKYLYVSIIILFFVGIKDDIILIDTVKKFGLQIFAAFVLVYWGDIRLNSMYGVLGIQQLPYGVSVGLSMFTILVITNSYNLIDGVNGLAGSIGVILSLTFGVWFYLGGLSYLAIISLSLAGALIAFLRFNLLSTRIFMGDTGSLVIGFVTSVLAIQFIELHHEMTSAYQVNFVPAIAIAILFIPLFDLLQVFITRILLKRSPLKPDKNHIHFRLKDLGFTDAQTTGVLAFVNLIIILLAVWLQRYQVFGTNSLLLLLHGLAVILLLVLIWKAPTKRAQE